jgi:hypothetical protein
MSRSFPVSTATRSIVVAAVALGAALVACGTDTDTAANPVVVDSGAADTGTPDTGSSEIADSGAPDAYTTVDAANIYDDAGAGDTCAYPTKCPQTRGVGPVDGISGDTGSPSASTTGTSSEWLTIRVNENDTSPKGKKLSLKATLTSAPGSVFDLYLYKNDGTAAAECTTVLGQAMDPSGNQTVQISWGEGAVSNGNYDSATVTIRVQHVSGPCDAGAWSLKLEGNAS